MPSQQSSTIGLMDILKPGITTLDLNRTRPFPPKMFIGLGRY